MAGLDGLNGQIDTLASKDSLLLEYSEKMADGGTVLSYSYSIQLDRVRRHRGPDRIWFVCPWCRRGTDELLYERPGPAFFFCPTCLGLDEEDETRRPGRPRSKRPYVRKKPLVLTPRKSETEAFCCRCRDRRELLEPEPVTMANGRPALRGRCVECGTWTSTIITAR